MGPIAMTIGGGLDLSGAELGKRLSATPAKYQLTYASMKNPENCDPGALIIDPVNHSRSVLLRKVKAMQSCGDSMPASGSLSAGAVGCVATWIQSFSVR